MRPPMMVATEHRRRFLSGASVWGLLLAGALLSCRGQSPSSELEDVFRQLHGRVYDIYELGPDRDSLHDWLAASFVGEALTREYVEHFTTLTRMGRESTSIRILAVDYEQVQVLTQTADMARVDADWSVGGVVTHRGHRHARTNRYQAVYDLERQAEGWRIAQTRLRDLQRVRGYSQLEGEDEDGDGEGDSPARSSRGMMSPLDLLRAGMAEDVEALKQRQRENPAAADPSGSDPSGSDPSATDLPPDEEPP